MVAPEAAVKEVANSESRRPLAHDKSSKCAGVYIGGAVPIYEAANRKSAPQRRGLANILDIDETGATVKF